MSERIRTTAEIDVWGTILFIDVASSKVGLDELNAGLAEVIEYVKVIDREFSTYKPDSQVSQIRRGELRSKTLQRRCKKSGSSVSAHVN